jgi:microcystin-dependent protein
MHHDMAICKLNIIMPLTRATSVNINSGTASSGAVLAADGAGGANWVKQQIPTPEIPIVTGVVLPGAVVHYAMQTAPDGWLVCNGSAVSRLTYPALFAAIGTSYGAGDGATTFKLPDLRGEFIRGWDNGRGIDKGRTFGTLQAESFKSHNHTVTDPGHSHGIIEGNDNGRADGDYVDSTPTNPGSSFFTNSSKTNITIAATGGAETRPRNVALLPCIKY